MIQMPLALNENQWIYNIVYAPEPRDDGFFKSRTRIHANQWPGIYRKLDLISPIFRTTQRFICMRLECGFLGANGTEPGSANHLCTPATVKVKRSWSGEHNKVLGRSCSAHDIVMAFITELVEFQSTGTPTRYFGVFQGRTEEYQPGAPALGI